MPCRGSTRKDRSLTYCRESNERTRNLFNVKKLGRASHTRLEMLLSVYEGYFQLTAHAGLLCLLHITSVDRFCSLRGGKLSVRMVFGERKCPVIMMADLRFVTKKQEQQLAWGLRTQLIQKHLGKSRLFSP
jgi:hypothetical protein